MSFNHPTLDVRLRDLVSCHDVDALRARLTPSPERSPQRIRDDLSGRDAAGNTLWLFAAHYGHLGVMDLLAPLVQRHHRNDKGLSALHWAAGNGQLQAVQALVDRWGLPMDARDHQGLTVLMRAAAHGSMATLEYLLPFADVLDQDHQGLNALGHAWQGRNWTAADRLACAMPADRVVPSIEAVLTGGSLNPERLVRRLPVWSVAQEQHVLRKTLDDPAPSTGRSNDPLPPFRSRL